MSNKFPAVMSGPDGSVIGSLNLGKYHRQAISTVFEMLGGVDGLHAWAQENRSDYYLKLYPKIIPREVEVQASEGVEDLLRQLDAKMIDITPKEIPDDVE